MKAAGLVLVVGTLLIVVPALAHLSDVWTNPFGAPQTTVTEVTRTGSQVTTKTTRSEAHRSFLEKALAPGGLLLLRIGLVALAAFLAGAVVQRTLLGDFALKMGPLEVPELQRAAAASDEALSAISTELAQQARATEIAMKVAADAAEGVSELARENRSLKERVHTLIELLEGGASEPPRNEEEQT